MRWLHYSFTIFEILGLAACPPKINCDQNQKQRIYVTTNS